MTEGRVTSKHGPGRSVWVLLGLSLASVALSSFLVRPSEGWAEDWGFYAHREINRLAIATVPAPLTRFYKSNAAFVRAHAVDPDKRRYAAKLEGPRHFVDMERFGDGTMASLPRTFAEFHATYTSLYCVQGGDSVRVRGSGDSLYVGAASYVLPKGAYRAWYARDVQRAHWRELDTLHVALPTEEGPTCDYLSVTDTMTQHGVLPYHLVTMQRRLTDAFRQNNQVRALQLSAEIGHYIGDATVPLHTTENYNGQLTGQRGVHAFWESRLPELFAAEEYDVLVGRARYIEDATEFYRDIIEESHVLVDSVLLIEADLRRRLPEDAQDCYEERLGRITRVPCRGFSQAYSDRLDGMVEARYRRAIRAVGSAWYTAWVDAGQPVVGGEAVASGLSLDSTYRRLPGLDGKGH